MEGKRFIRTLRLENFLSYGSEGEEIELQPLNVSKVRQASPYCVHRRCWRSRSVS